MPIPHRALGACCLLVLIALGGIGHAAEPSATAYRLAVGDRISVMTFGRADLTGEFTVGTDQVIRLPLLGPIPAAGRSREEVETAVSERLSKVLGYDTTVTIDMAAYRPVFVIGDVITPGEIAYVPGMTALQAYAKAGGAASLHQLPNQIANQMATVQREMLMAQTELNGLLVRRAALETALDGATAIVLPEELRPIAQSPSIVAAVHAETALLQARRKDLESRIVLIARERELLGEEVAALEGQIAALGLQSEAVAEELSRVGGLAEQGLATSQRMLELKRSKAATDGNRYEATAYLSRAHQEITQLDLQLQTLEAELRSERLDERRRVEGEISLARARVAGVAGQMTALSEVNIAEVTNRRGEITIAISRTAAGAAQTVANADSTTLLQPGDIVQVTVAKAWPETAGQSRRHAALPASAAASLD